MKGKKHNKPTKSFMVYADWSVHNLILLQRKQKTHSILRIHKTKKEIYSAKRSFSFSPVFVSIRLFWLIFSMYEVWTAKGQGKWKRLNQTEQNEYDTTSIGKKNLIIMSWFMTLLLLLWLVLFFLASPSFPIRGFRMLALSRRYASKIFALGSKINYN